MRPNMFKSRGYIFTSNALLPPQGSVLSVSGRKFVHLAKVVMKAEGFVT